MYGITVVETKRKPNKYIIILIIICLLLSCIFGIIGYIIINKQKPIITKVENTGELITISKTKDIMIKLYTDFLPKLDEEAQKNIDNIYYSDYKRVFLTFDDGPSKLITPLILDTLKENNVKATFFVLGSSVDLNPEILRRTYQEGHFIANHGYSHVYKNIYQKPEAVLDEYLKTEQAIRNALGIQEYSSHLFRFPGGSNGGYYNKTKQAAKEVLRTNNIAYIDWNALTEDSVGNKTKEQMMDYLISTCTNKNSIVVLLHDTGDKVLTYEMLPDIIKYFKEQGYVFENFYSIL